MPHIHSTLQEQKNVFPANVNDIKFWLFWEEKVMLSLFFPNAQSINYCEIKTTFFRNMLSHPFHISLLISLFIPNCIKFYIFSLPRQSLIKNLLVKVFMILIKYSCMRDTIKIKSSLEDVDVLD